MHRRILGPVTLAAFLSVAALGQNQEGYLRVSIVKVKPDKRAEFDAAVKRMADANRRHQGTDWIAAETIYGEGNTLYFSSLRPSLGEMEKGGEAFMAALAKAGGGPAGIAKTMQDLGNSMISSRAELRRRRTDLSSNVPDEAGLLKLIGESRYNRTTVIRIRPGRLADYEEQLRTNKAARERSGSRTPVFVSQSAAGQQGTAFYITQLAKSLGDWDGAPSLPSLLGPDGYRRYTATTREAVLSTETFINRYLPELSNPAENVVSAAPAFWRPKPAATPKPKPATGQ